jgi:transcriptional regulator with XRE-family HTH domain
MLDQNATTSELVAAKSTRSQPRLPMATGGQIRMARALLRWSAAELARRARVSPRTIHNAEAADGTPRMQIGTMERIERALEDAGVEFIRENTTGGAGVRLRRRP